MLIELLCLHDIVMILLEFFLDLFGHFEWANLTTRCLHIILGKSRYFSNNISKLYRSLHLLTSTSPEMAMFKPDQAIIWSNAGILLTGCLGTNFNEILIEIHKFAFKKIHFKMPSGKWRPSCLSLHVLKHTYRHNKLNKGAGGMSRLQPYWRNHEKFRWQSIIWRVMGWLTG